jgi:hypothetical protein
VPLIRPIAVNIILSEPHECFPDARLVPKQHIL